MAAGSQAGEARVEGVRADAVVDDRQSLTAVEALHLGREIADRGGKDHLGGPGTLRQLGLRRGRRGADHPAAEMGDELGQEQPHATGSRMHEHRVAPLNQVGVLDEIVRGHALEEHGGGGLEADVVGQRHQPGGVHDGPLGIRAGNLHPADPVPDCDVVDAGADVDDRAGALGARGEGQREAVAAFAVIDVEEVDPGRGDLHDRLARTRPRLVHLGLPQHLGTAHFVHLNRPHDPSNNGFPTTNPVDGDPIPGKRTSPPLPLPERRRPPHPSGRRATRGAGRGRNSAVGTPGRSYGVEA